MIDEAHCFSTWGQDFRVDYLYIGDFLRQLQQKKQLTRSIPVSCFTATAKRKVIEDIQSYFQRELQLDLVLFRAPTGRKNLKYSVIPQKDEESKYNTLRNLAEKDDRPSIVYVSRTKRAYELADRLTKDGLNAKPYHGKMNKEEKTANQEGFLNDDIDIMVATSAFGMGVDKKNVGQVIHYEISDSLENYVQEAGRAGRDEDIEADCYVLYNEEDLNKHFILLNQTKLSIREIQQVWRAVKALTAFRKNISNSALEIARKAGWDENINDLETLVKTALAALEEAGYLKRGQNSPRVFATSILSANAQEAIDIIEKSSRFNKQRTQYATRIIKSLFGVKRRKSAQDAEAESRIDYLADRLGIPKNEVIECVNLMRSENILADTQDLNAFVKKGGTVNRSLQIVEDFAKLERFLLQHLKNKEQSLSIKEINQGAEDEGIGNVSAYKIKTLFNFWVKTGVIKKRKHENNDVYAVQPLIETKEIKDISEKRNILARFIVEFLFKKIKEEDFKDPQKLTVSVEFSCIEIISAFESQNTLFRFQPDFKDIEQALLYLSQIDAIEIEGGFMVIYNRLTLERLEDNNRVQYKMEDYKKLNEYYDSKIEQIHIVGGYAQKMIKDYREALKFADDYFNLNYGSFLKKYFNGRRDHIKRTLTPGKFKELFGEISTENDHRK